MDIYGSLRDFFVYTDEESDGIAGVCAMNIIWENLAEVRSLYVEDAYRVVTSAGIWWKPVFRKPLPCNFTASLRLLIEKNFSLIWASRR